MSPVLRRGMPSALHVKINLIAVIILKIVNSMIKVIRKLLENSKMKLQAFLSQNS